MNKNVNYTLNTTKWQIVPMISKLISKTNVENITHVLVCFDKMKI